MSAQTRDTYERPFERMADYVIALLRNAVPAEAIVLGALGRNTHVGRRVDTGVWSGRGRS